jgi:hypothetical protein
MVLGVGFGHCNSGKGMSEIDSSNSIEVEINKCMCFPTSEMKEFENGIFKQKRGSAV